MQNLIIGILLIFSSNLASANYAGELVLDAAKSYGITDERLLLMINNSKADLSVKDKKGMTALHWSAKKGRVSTAKVLCDHGASPNTQDNLGNTPLMYAVEDLYVSITQILIDCGADPGIKNNRGISPLDMGKRYKHKELTTLMVREIDYRKAEAAKEKFLRLRKKKQARSRWRKISTGIAAASGFNQALVRSIEKGNERAASAAVKKGANPNFSLKGVSVLMMAINKKMDKVAVELIDKGANPKYTFKGMSTLVMAINKKSEKVASVLIENGADPKLTFRGSGLVIMALKNNMNKTAEDLIKKGADVKKKDFKGITTLELAVENRDADIADLLIRSGADARGYASNREPHLVNAVLKKDVEMVKTLLRGGASVLETGKMKKSPLNLAMEQNLDVIYSELLKKINLKGDYCDLQYRELLRINEKKYRKVTNFTTGGLLEAEEEMDKLTGDMGEDFDKTLEANAKRGIKYKIGQWAITISTGLVTGPMALVYSRKIKKYKKTHDLLRSALENKYNRDIILLGRKAKTSVDRTRQWLVIGNVTKAFCAGKRLDVLSEKGIMKWVRSRK